MCLQFAPDVAAAFAAAAMLPSQGSPVFTLPGIVITVEEYIAQVEQLVPALRGRLRCEGTSLPFPAKLASDGVTEFLGPLPQTPLAEGIARTIVHFQHQGLPTVPATRGD
ncbi:MAG: hypothetical protein K6U89_11970 [Chloroflexi bacterium]|nr:hypothetical protein [Chloroflexota bacterium]